jgi:hypothetical protein
MTTPFAVTIGVLAAGLLYVTVPGILEVLAKYRKRHTVRCPETGRETTVKIDVGHAARTSTYGRPDLRIAECSEWPERQDCDQDCLSRPEGHGARPDLRPAG